MSRIDPAGLERRVGDSVARVRKLENIRNFLTSSALMSVIDLFLTFVLLAVMLLYSPFLTFIVLGAFPFYIGISAFATPPFRAQLDEKFRRVRRIRPSRSRAKAQRRRGSPQSQPAARPADRWTQRQLSCELTHLRILNARKRGKRPSCRC